jgi:hypothetical protein
VARGQGAEVSLLLSAVAGVLIAAALAFSAFEHDGGWGRLALLLGALIALAFANVAFIFWQRGRGSGETQE